jgi:hypothetical protein
MMTGVRPKAFFRSTAICRFPLSTQDAQLGGRPRHWLAAGKVGSSFGTLVRLLILTGQRRPILGRRFTDVERSRRIFSGVWLEEAAAGQLPEHGDRGRKPRRMHLLLDPLAAFGAEAQTNGLAVDRDVRLEQRRRAARAAQPRILLAARTYGAARDEIDDSREREGAGRLAGPAPGRGEGGMDKRRGQSSLRRHLAHPCRVQGPLSLREGLLRPRRLECQLDGPRRFTARHS